MRTLYRTLTPAASSPLFFSLKAVLTGLLISVLAAVPAAAIDVPIQLQNGTATFSQTCFHPPSGSYSPDEAVDGNFTDTPVNGWGVGEGTETECASGDSSHSQTAVWETATNLEAGGLTFTMYFNHFNPGALLGRFRLSGTTDDRATFADGLDTGGDVDANWTVLTAPSVSGPAGMTFTSLADHSILAGGTIPAQGVYTVSYTTAISGITGIRLEALEHESLPFNGPGFLPSNGAFLLTEMTLDASPSCVPPPSGLVSWWPGDGDANDIQDNNNGTLQNGATFAQGEVGQAFSFDGVDDAVLVPHNANQNTGGQMTIDAWVNPSSSGHGRPIAQKRSSGNVGGYTFETTHTPYGPDNGLQFILWIGGTSRTLQTPANVLVLGTWQHVAATYDATTMKIYVDGVERASLAVSGVIDAVTDPLVMGRNVVNPSFAWHGFIDEVELHNRALSAAEIQAIFNAGSAGKCKPALPDRCDGDVNGDGMITPADALCVFQKFLGRPSCLD